MALFDNVWLGRVDAKPVDWRDEVDDDVDPDDEAFVLTSPDVIAGLGFDPLEKIEKYNPNHKPAGSSEGGQFAGTQWVGMSVGSAAEVAAAEARLDALPLDTQSEFFTHPPAPEINVRDIWPASRGTPLTITGARSGKGWTEYVDVNPTTLWRGTGFSPIGGGNFVMIDGLIIAGPRGEVLKPASEVPAVMDALNRAYENSLRGKGGDFGEAQPPTNSGEMGRLLSGYKSPLTGDMYAKDFMGPLATAYFNKAPVVTSSKDNLFTRAKASLDKAIASMPGQDMSYWEKDHLKEYEGQGRVQKIVRALNESQWRAGMLGQDTVNAFGYMVDQSQAVIRESHPGETSLTLYRGVKGEYAANLKKTLKSFPSVDIAVHPVSSWTSDLSVAKTFATKSGAVIKRTVPISEILFSHEGPKGTGLSAGDYLFGGTEEYEYLVGHRQDSISVAKEDLV